MGHYASECPSIEGGMSGSYHFPYPREPKVTILPYPLPDSPERRRKKEEDFDFSEALRLMKMGFVVKRRCEEKTYRLIEGHLYSREHKDADIVRVFELPAAHIVATDWKIF